jgi:carbon-monoxide dehydrogenase catalytic subunit
VATTVEEDGEVKDRDIDEIALEVAEKALNEWGKASGELLYAKRAPAPLYEKWKKTGVVPRNIDREIVEIMHRTHMGVDQDYKNLMKQGTRAALADGWGGSMLATDLQDVLFGTPYPFRPRANLGVMKEDHVNIIVHGHEPILSEMIVAMCQKPEMHRIRQVQGRQGHPAGRHLLYGQRDLPAPRRAPGRHLPAAGTGHHHRRLRRHGGGHPVHHPEPGQRGQCFHTKLITTHPIAKMEQDNVHHIEFDEHHALEDAEKSSSIGIDNFQNRGRM